MMFIRNILEFDLERGHHSTMIFLGVIYYLEEKRSLVPELTMATHLPRCIIIQEMEGVNLVHGLGD